MSETKSNHGGARVGAGRKKGVPNSKPRARKEVTKDEIIYVRMTTEQKELLKTRAEQSNMKMSEYILSKLF